MVAECLFNFHGRKRSRLRLQLRRHIFHQSELGTNANTLKSKRRRLYRISRSAKSWAKRLSNRRPSMRSKHLRQHQSPGLNWNLAASRKRQKMLLMHRSKKKRSNRWQRNRRSKRSSPNWWQSRRNHLNQSLKMTSRNGSRKTGNK